MTATKVKTAALAALAALLLATGPLFGQGPALEKLWADLASKDEAQATRAALKLAATPPETLALLKAKLKVVKLADDRFAALLKQLDSDEFDARDAAYQELEYHGKTIRGRLEKAVENKPSPEVRNQLTRLIEASYGDDLVPPPAAPLNPAGGISISTIGGKRIIKIDGREIDLNPKVIEKRGPQPAWVQAARAVAVLEHLESPEAKALLKNLADGEADALPTKAAAAALGRLNK